MVKQKDPIWNFFAVVEQDNKTSASCIDCKAVVSAKDPRLRVLFKTLIFDNCPLNLPYMPYLPPYLP